MSWYREKRMTLSFSSFTKYKKKSDAVPCILRETTHVGYPVSCGHSYKQTYVENEYTSAPKM
jgi:hypothetical protein